MNVHFEKSEINNRVIYDAYIDDKINKFIWNEKVIVDIDSQRIINCEEIRASLPPIYFSGFINAIKTDMNNPV